MKLDVYRDNTVVAQLPVSTGSTYSHQLMGEHKLSLSGIIVPDALSLALGDYVLYNGEKYYLNTAPGCIKHSNFRYEYALDFEHVSYRLFDKKLMQNGEFVTDYFGYPTLYLQLIVDNMNQIDTGWQVGTVEDMPEKHIAFEDGVTCRAALTAVAESFKLEYYFTGKTIHLVKSAGLPTTLSFSQGRGKGLYTFQLQRRNDANVVTRVYGFGAAKNIPPDYRVNAAGIGAERLRVEVQEQNVDLYGVKEGIYKNEEIFPQRTSTLTGASDVGNLYFFVSDTTLDFNINDQLLEGLEAKVVFKSGDLAGYTFAISSYDAGTKTMRLNVDKTQEPQPMPNATFVPKAGDKYTLVDLRMPQTYVDAAEAKLLEESLQYLEENSRPKLQFNLNLDEQYVRTQGIRLVPGDRVRVVEEKLGVDSMIRTTSVSWPLLNKDKITATIADFVPYTQVQRILSETIENRKEIVVQDRINAERARRTARELRELRGLIQDPDGEFDMSQVLKPGSISTLYLSVGAKSQNFGLNNVKVSANYLNDPNALHISAGQLIHYELQIEGLGYVWQMQEKLVQGLDPNKTYYLAAKVERTALRGVWSVTEDFRQTEQEAGVWYFNLGVLYPVRDGYRNLYITKGMTTIVGDTITTGKLQSIDKINFFNLSNGTFNLGDEASGLDWGVTKEGQLTIRGAALADKFMVGEGETVNAFISGITDNGPLSVRFSAGPNGEFKVLDNGELFASKLNAQGGKIGAWNIDRNGLYSDDGQGYFRVRKYLNPNDAAQGWIQSRIGGDGAFFQNTQRNTGGVNVAATFSASGGKHNVAAQLNGGLRLYGAMYVKIAYINSTSYTCTNEDYMVVQRGNTSTTVNLPASPWEGQVVEVRKYYNKGMRVNGNGKKIMWRDMAKDYIDGGFNERFTFDGNNWLRLTENNL